MYEFNSLAFITAGGPVSIAVALILITMSVTSWYLIVSKSVKAWQLHQASKAYKQHFWSAPTLAKAIKQEIKISLACIAKHGVAAADHYKIQAAKSTDMVSKDELIARALNRSMATESAKMESGLIVLASVGSVSPFVGLFGTVWGIYHALASISLSGQATLDKVAGPVGEALIMTALGLAVAIPAVLAYNAFVRSNRILSAEQEAFAYDLHNLLTTGAVIHINDEDKKSEVEAKEFIHIVGAAA